MSKENYASVSQPCPQLPGTAFRIFIPAGATINILNLIELTSPSGICLILRWPFLGGTLGETMGKIPGCPDLTGFMNSIRAAGGTVEVV